jgi:hypothetical protein
MFCGADLAASAALPLGGGLGGGDLSPSYVAGGALTLILPTAFGSAAIVGSAVLPARPEQRGALFTQRSSPIKGEGEEAL